MTVDRSFVTENDATRARLRALVDRLADADLQRSLGGDWTVAAALAHLAFWDRRAVLILGRWAAGQPPPPDDPASPEADILNDALLPEWRLLPPRPAARLALDAAEAADQAAARLGNDVLGAIVARGEGWRLQRFRHRREHLEEVERALGVA